MASNGNKVTSLESISQIVEMRELVHEEEKDI
jgi:hypothetical protein